jgi:hypothetical protein
MYCNKSYQKDRLNSLVPPSLLAGTEVRLAPGVESDLAIFGNIAVGKSKGKRSGSTDDVTIRSVLGSMARAHELVLGGRPWDDTSQVSADSVKSVRLKGLVLLDNKVAARRSKNVSK